MLSPNLSSGVVLATQSLDLSSKVSLSNLSLSLNLSSSLSRELSSLSLELFSLYLVSLSKNLTTPLSCTCDRATVVGVCIIENFGVGIEACSLFGQTDMACVCARLWRVYMFRCAYNLGTCVCLTGEFVCLLWGKKLLWVCEGVELVMLTCSIVTSILVVVQGLGWLRYEVPCFGSSTASSLLVSHDLCMLGCGCDVFTVLLFLFWSSSMVKLGLFVMSSWLCSWTK